VTVAWVAACPWLYFYGIYERLSIYKVYTSGLLLPEDYAGAWVNWIPLAGALAGIAGGGLWSAWRSGVTAGAGGRGWVQAVALSLLLAGVFFLSNRDENFRTLLAIQRAAAGERWERVLEEARAARVTNRAIILYRNVALLKQERLCEEMFSFPREDLSLPGYPRLVDIAGSDLLFHHGRLNHAYRWAMEHLVQHGMKVDYLRCMIKVALLTGEFPLAQKYVNTLSRTLFHAGEARKYQQYIRQPDLINEEPGFRSLRGLLSYHNLLGEGTGSLESYLLEYFKVTPPATVETLELSMAAVLTLKARDRFRALFPIYRENGLKVPRHVQEAALLFAYQEKRVEEIPGITPAVRGRFERLLNDLERHAGAGMPTMLKRSYGDTYWYYFLAVTNLKTN
jgi:hypothetical protein